MEKGCHMGKIKKKHFPRVVKKTNKIIVLNGYVMEIFIFY